VKLQEETGEDRIARSSEGLLDQEIKRLLHREKGNSYERGGKSAATDSVKPDVTPGQALKTRWLHRQKNVSKENQPERIERALVLKVGKTL